MSSWMAWSICSYDCNISTIIWWIAIEFRTDIHDLLGINHQDLCFPQHLRIVDIYISLWNVCSVRQCLILAGCLSHSINTCRPQEPDQCVILTLTNPQPLRLCFKYGLGTGILDCLESHSDIHVPAHCSVITLVIPSLSLHTWAKFDFVQLMFTTKCPKN